MTDASRMNRTEVLEARLRVLKLEHRDLDDAIRLLEERVGYDMLAMRRMKKRKLAIKDSISRLEDDITPDIIA